jgi:hypothetical protein
VLPARTRCIAALGAALAVVLLGLFFGCIGGHPRSRCGNRLVRLRCRFLLFLLFRLSEKLRYTQLPPHARKISATATSARKAVIFPRLRFFSLLAGCTGSFSSSSCALRSRLSPCAGFALKLSNIIPACAGDACVHQMSSLVFVFHGIFPFIKI